MRTSGFRVTPKPSDRCPYNRKTEGDFRHRAMGVEASEGGGRDWNHAAPSQGMPGTSRNGRRQEGLSPGLSRESGILLTP